jgi:CheY-like chemotaxis protein
MNAIIGFASLLNEPDQDKNSQAEYVDVITQSCYNLLGIVTDIIEISNIEAGILSLNLKSTSLRTIIKAINSQFSNKISEKGIVFKINPEILTEEIILNTDEAKLKEILKNLLNNALKFTSRGVIELDYKVKGDFIEFRVSDTGIGISLDQQKKIFERFYQVESEINRQYEGAGLGLSISKGYVNPLGGEIWVDSQPGRGATFYFTIPFVTGHKSDMPDVLITKLPKIIPADIKTLLIVEDEEYNFKYIEAVLSPLNFRLIHAGNGQEAVDICKSDNSIDLVVMDIKMPVMDGYEATSIIKKIRPLLPIIAQTAYAFEADKENAINAGCDDYIAKPVKKQVLIDTIMKYLSN